MSLRSAASLSRWPGVGFELDKHNEAGGTNECHQAKPPDEAERRSGCHVLCAEYGEAGELNDECLPDVIDETG